MVKILVVDDDASVLASTAALLREIGHEVVTTSEADEVLPLTRRHRPDLVLQDLRMRGLDAADLLRELRRDPDVGATPVILFTASAEAHEFRERLPVQGVLEKPFSVDALRAAVVAVARR